MAGDDITLGELGRRLDRLEQSFDQRATGLSRQIEGLQFVHRDTYDVQHAAHEARIKDLEEAKTWFARGLVTAVLFPIITALILAVVLTR